MHLIRFNFWFFFVLFSGFLIKSTNYRRFSFVKSPESVSRKVPGSTNSMKTTKSAAIANANRASFVPPIPTDSIRINLIFNVIGNHDRAFALKCAPVAQRQEINPKREKIIFGLFISCPIFTVRNKRRCKNIIQFSARDLLARFYHHHHLLDYAFTAPREGRHEDLVGNSCDFSITFLNNFTWSL